MVSARHTYDVIVLGAGPVGQNAAERPRAGGLSVAMVERELVGGECSYWGCVPSKALLRPVIAVADADHIDGAREAVTGPIDAAGVFGRRDRYVSNWDDAGQAEWVAGIGARPWYAATGDWTGLGACQLPTPAARLPCSPRAMPW